MTRTDQEWFEALVNERFDHLELKHDAASADIKSLHADVHSLRTEILKLQLHNKYRQGWYGLLGGAIPAVVVFLVMYVRGVM
ncbi:MAG: hypothetical protein ACOC0P_00725 [Planctomycetota bacterium]